MIRPPKLGDTKRQYATRTYRHSAAWTVASIFFIVWAVLCTVVAWVARDPLATGVGLIAAAAWVWLYHIHDMDRAVARSSLDHQKTCTCGDNVVA
jgi:hypothetical protein